MDILQGQTYWALVDGKRVRVRTMYEHPECRHDPEGGWEVVRLDTHEIIRLSCARGQWFIESACCAR